MKPEYIDFLIAEYKKAGLKPEVVVVDHKRYIIPCWYVQNCAAPLKSFLTQKPNVIAYVTLANLSLFTMLF